MRLVLQELIEAEATEAVGAGRYERSDARVNERNGHRPRLLATQAGDVELRIPKLRKAHCLIVGDRGPVGLHGIVCEGSITGVSPDRCTVTAGASEGE